MSGRRLTGARAAGSAATAGLILLLLVAAARPLAYGIDDADFFWHLKTGAWIWEHGSLPREFLFSQTAPATMDATQRVTMTSYWAVQVLYHLVHARGGLPGIVALRVVLMAFLVGSLLFRRIGADRLIFLGNVLLGVIVLRVYLFERPQVFSFLFFSLLLLALDRIRRAAPGTSPRAALLALPLLMIAWANCHGGFVIGQGVILLTLAAEGVKFVHPALGPLPGARYRQLATAGAAGVLGAFLNPNTWHVASVARLPAWMKAGNLEYQSTVTFFRENGEPAVVVFWLLLALAILSVALDARRPDLTSLALVGGTGIVAFGGVRYLAFFVICAVPMIARVFSRVRFLTAGRLLVTLPALAAGLFLLPGDLRYLEHADRAAAVSPLDYPVDAADFLEAHDLRGNMYNYWPWGGYLIWRLPTVRDFSDGRNSQHAVFQMNVDVEAGNKRVVAGQPRWESVFREHGIRYTVIPIFYPRGGGVQDLLFALADSPAWAPVFIGANAVIFVEDTPENRGVERLPLASRDQFLSLLVERCAQLNERLPSYPFPFIARGDLLVRLRRFDAARAAYRSALAIVPFNQRLRRRLAELPP